MVGDVFRFPVDPLAAQPPTHTESATFAQQPADTSATHDRCVSARTQRRHKSEDAKAVMLPTFSPQSNALPAAVGESLAHPYRIRNEDSAMVKSRLLAQYVDKVMSQLANIITSKSNGTQGGRAVFNYYYRLQNIRTYTFEQHVLTHTHPTSQHGK